MKHTKGPWTLKPHGAIFGPNNEYIADFGVSSRYENAPANAQLIAAAPDLFAALEATELAEDTWANCTDCENRGAESPESGCGRCFNLADKARIMRRAAIAKVKGEKPAPILRLEGAQPN